MEKIELTKREKDLILSVLSNEYYELKHSGDLGAAEFAALIEKMGGKVRY